MNKINKNIKKNSSQTNTSITSYFSKKTRNNEYECGDSDHSYQILKFIHYIMYLHV